MGKYILKRIVFFFPTLIIISLLAFIISINAPGDPVDRMLNAAQSGGELNVLSSALKEQESIVRKKLGLDLPIFYFSISNIATPDTIYKFYDKAESEALKRLIKKYGDWKEIAAYNRSLKKLYTAHDSIQLDSSVYALYQKNNISDAINQSKFTASSLLATYDDKVIQAKFDELKNLYQQYSFFNGFAVLLYEAIKNYDAVQQNKTPLKAYIPSMHFYASNQYERWIFGDGNWLTGKNTTYTKGIIRGDFGTSYVTKLSISATIRDRIRWSLFFTFISVLLAYAISLPIGIKAASKKDSLFDRTSSVILFILYSMPAFWIATLLLMTFANPSVLAIFPPSQVGPATGIPAGTNFFELIKIRLPYLILPTICYTYAQLAFLSRITRVSTLEIISQDYIRTARAKGLSEKKVIYKHAFRNALLPVITVFSNIFPAAIGGSVILETIFTIPGMGHEIYLAIQNHDYPMIIDVFTITGVLTLTGYLVADILYAFADPRISFASK